MLCLSQVLEYYPSPWDEWLNIGNLPSGRALHAVISIGPEQFDCMAGESFCQNALNWFSQSNPAQNAPNCLLLTASLVSLLLDPRFARIMETLVIKIMMSMMVMVKMMIIMMVMVKMMIIMMRSPSSPGLPVRWKHRWDRAVSVDRQLLL